MITDEALNGTAEFEDNYCEAIIIADEQREVSTGGEKALMHFIVKTQVASRTSRLPLRALRLLLEDFTAKTAKKAAVRRGALQHQ